MNRKGYIRYWKDSSDKDWKRVNLLLKNRDYVFALFCMHLSLEKLLKAHWIKDNQDFFPPRIHNLNRLLQQTRLQLSDDEKELCADMNKFQIEGRYPDYVSSIYKVVNRKYAFNYFKQCQQLRKKLTATLR